MAEVVLHNKTDVELLNETGLHYIITNRNIEAFLAQRLRGGRDQMGGYRTFDHIVEEMEDIQADFDNIVSEPVSIGESIEGRDIWAIKISDNPEEDEDEPEVLYTALIHSREVITAEVLFNYIYYLVDNYGNDEYVTWLVDERQMWFIPCHNPDGYVKNEEDDPEGGGMWRKNCRRNDEDEVVGVDLNRNFGYMWGYDNTGSSPRESSPTYRGTGPFSEPETQAIREFVNDHNFKISIYFHSWGNLVLYPYGYDYFFPEDLDVFNSMAKTMSAENGYMIGTGWEVLYPTNGDSDDWIYGSDEHDPIMSVTVEVGSHDDYFWPPLNRVEPLVEENLETCLTAAEYCDEPRRYLRPPIPENVTAITDQHDNIVIRWEDSEDEINEAVSYRVRAYVPDDPIFDDAPEDQELWDTMGISSSGANPHSEPFCYRFVTTDDMATLTLIEDIPAPDTLWAWVRYNFRDYLPHGIALEVSYDGFVWIPVPGADTENIVTHDINLGPALRGDSEGWMRTEWYLGEYVGEMVKLRFRYYQFARRIAGEIAYIDDIGPFPQWQDREILAEDIENWIWIDRDHELNDGLQYQVQAVDAEGDVSFWSVPTTPVEGPERLTIGIPIGWSMISSPMELVEPNLWDVFAELLDKGIINLVKDVDGEFFSPAWDYNGIDDWDPLCGYQIRLNRPAELELRGYFLPEDTPIPLEVNWNIVTYLPSEHIPIEDALCSIEDNLIIAKDGYGRFCLPEWEFNNIPDMHQGEGYFVLLEDEDTLIYPVVHGDFAFEPEQHAFDLAGFEPPGPDNNSLLLQFDEPLKAGIVSLVDGDGNQCGRLGTVDGQTSIGLAAWGEAEDGESGYQTGEPFRAFWIADDTSDEIELSLSVIKGKPVYMKNGITIMSAHLQRSALPIEHGVVSAFPNPFNGSVVLTFDLAELSHINLSIYDAAGRLMDQIASGNHKIGQHRIVWNGVDRPSGLYIARLDVLSKNKTTRTQTKLLLIR